MYSKGWRITSEPMTDTEFMRQSIRSLIPQSRYATSIWSIRVATNIVVLLPNTHGGSVSNYASRIFVIVAVVMPMTTHSPGLIEEQVLEPLVKLSRCYWRNFLCSLSDSFHSHMTSPPDPPLKRFIPLLSSFSHVYSSHSIIGILTPNLTHHHPYPYPTPIVLILLSLFPFLYPLFTCFVMLLAQHSCIVLHHQHSISHRLWLGDLYIKASVVSCRINQEVFSPSLRLSLSLRSSQSHRLTPGNQLKSSSTSKSKSSRKLPVVFDQSTFKTHRLTPVNDKVQVLIPIFILSGHQFFVTVTPYLCPERLRYRPSARRPLRAGFKVSFLIAYWYRPSS